jgi:hypothetical protein
VRRHRYRGPVNHGRAGEAKRVFLHVGSPKTGTTFLQNVLWSQRQLAAQQGVLLPLERFADHYLASLDVRGLSGRKEHPARAVGIWDRLVKEAEAWPGATLVSHELFAAATADQAASAVASFGADTEVHVVLTARDLVRQIPAEWQEHVKHRSTKTLPAFVEELREDTAGSSWFWRVQDFGEVVARWGASVPASRVHVVTVPPSGADPGTLWNRFATLLGLDPASFDTRQSRANTSLGIEQSELLRRVNAELGDRVRLPGPYPVVVKNVLAHRVLAARTGTQLALDRDATEFAVRRSAEIAEHLRRLQVDVVGDLDDLVPDLSTALAAASAGPYTEPAAEVLLAESVSALAGLLDAMAKPGPQRRYEELVRELKHAPVRFVLRRASERSPVLAWARRARRRAIALGRRSAGTRRTG